MIRHDAQLKGDARYDKNKPECQKQRIALLGDDRARDKIDVERAGCSVNHRHAVEQHARGKRPEHEILHRRLGGTGTLFLERDQRVQRERHQFDAEVEREEAVAGDDHLDAEQDEQRQYERFAAEQASCKQIAARIEQHQRNCDKARHSQEVGEHIVDDHVVKRFDDVELRRFQRYAGGNQQRELRQPIGDVSPLVVDEEIDNQNERCRRQNDDLRQYGEQVLGERHVRASSSRRARAGPQRKRA